jgi:urease gamma subunit
LLREAVKFAWSGGLSAYASSGGKAILDDDVLGILLGAVGASAMETFEDDGEESESKSDDEGSGSDDSGDHEGVFSSAAGTALGLNEGASDVDMKGREDEGESASEEEDVQLDPAQLESMLLEDSDALLDEEDDDEDVLEHHAGADAALAQLIKLKQDARKAGRQALERLEIARQLRCVMLVDTLLSNPGRQWTNLLQSNLFMKMVLPLLQARIDLEKKLERASANQLGKKSAASDSEKRALLERLTSLLKNKLCKIRCSKGSQDQSDDAVGLVDQLMNQARKSSSTENLSCCSVALLATLKNMTDIDDMINASRVYGKALTEWSTRRTTKLQTNLFDDFVQQHQRYVCRNPDQLETLFDLVFTPLSNNC